MPYGHKVVSYLAYDLENLTSLFRPIWNIYRAIFYMLHNLSLYDPLSVTCLNLMSVMDMIDQPIDGNAATPLPRPSPLQRTQAAPYLNYLDENCR